MPIRFVALLGSSVERGNPELRLEDADQAQHYLQFDPGIVPAVATALLVRDRELASPENRLKTEQPFVLQSVTPVVGVEGALGLRLLLDGGLELSVLLSETSIRELRQAISSAEDISKPRDLTKPPN